jgi:glucosamine--fructose-6-phosphate aminotransferase (isomerizing)
VASTKAFVNTLGAFYLLAHHLARVHGLATRAQSDAALAKLAALPEAMRGVCAREDELREHAKRYFHGATSAFFLGRQASFGLAMEGALKLKEISYVHAEGYAAGELKHGPLALVTPGMPVVAFLAHGEPCHEVMISNVMEVRSRGGKVLGFLTAGDDKARGSMDAAFALPPCDPLHYPAVASVAIYLLSYHAALSRGCPIDKPRNLAKSVTVE